ncbi:protein msta isoform X2 [Anoplophora glabripennis]|nr:protein msta isoform X2 [Anoplophora glabripennis]
MEDADSKSLQGGPKFDVKVSKAMGRYMVSTKEIAPGEIILSEEPIVVGPCTGCKVQCLGCYRPLESETYFVKCPRCGWPLCSQTCPGLGQRHGHTIEECLILQKSKSSSLLDYSNLESLRLHLQAIVPLRCLILKRTDPSTFNIIWDMESHNDIRRNIPEVWNSNQVNVVNRITKDWGLVEFSEHEVHTVCGILEVNCFEIGQGINIRGLYPTAFLMSHDCVPNTNHTDEETNYKLTVRASTRISQGHPITLSYAYTLQNSLKRREHLLENKFFECHCKRCSDPTELGTYSGALICPKCKTGLVLCDKPLDAESSWSCNNLQGHCPGYSIAARSMKLLLHRISQEVEQIDLNDVEGMETFLKKYRNVLHPTHYLCFGIKVSLSQVYGKINGYLIYELSNELLERKRDLCTEILKVLDIIEPGYTRIRGVTLYEIHAPLMILLTRDMEDQSPAKSELRTRLREVLKYLTEASVILSYEPENSPEGIMGRAAKEALVQMRDWESIVGKL